MNLSLITKITLLLFLCVTSSSFQAKIDYAVANNIDISEENTWWTTFHHDPQHTGYINTSVPETSETLWIFSTHDWIITSPAVLNHRIYFTGGDGRLYCLNANTGKSIWNTTLYGTCSSPTIINNRLYVGSCDAHIYCIDAYNGEMIWDYATNDMVTSYPTVVYERLYIGSRDGNMYCLDANNGSLIWCFETTGLIDSSPAVADGLVYIGALYVYQQMIRGRFYCLSCENGTELWNYTTPGVIGTSPTIFNERVYFGSSQWDFLQGWYYCFHAHNGTLEWSYQVTGWPGATPAIHDGKVFIATNSVFNDNMILCLNATTGDEIWNCDTSEYGTISSPSITDEKMVIGLSDGKVYCLDSSNGTVQWTYQTDNFICASPALVNGKVYIGSCDGNIYCFGSDILSNMQKIPAFS